MSLELSPAKLILLAVHLASQADIDTLSFLVSRRPEALRKDIVLRILLTYLSERTPSKAYVPFLQELASGEFPDYDPVEIDRAHVEELSDDEAVQKVRGLRLLPLKAPAGPVDVGDNALAIFLVLRAHRVDQECGLTQVPDLLVPFLHTVPAIRSWMISTLLPLLRRNFEYYARHASPYTLAEFDGLPGPTAVSVLLSETSLEGDGLQLVGRDLRGMAGPWMLGGEKDGRKPKNSRLEHVLAWITLQAQNNWRLAVQVFEQWDGPVDIDLGEYGDGWWTDEQQRRFQAQYGQAGLATAYAIVEASVDGLDGAFRIFHRLSTLWGHMPNHDSLESLASALESIPDLYKEGLLPLSMPPRMGGNLLDDENPLTKPAGESLLLLKALITSAFILTKSGLPCTVRRAYDITFLHSAKEQGSEAVRFIHAIASRAPKNDDGYWNTARRELLWLQLWGPDVDSPESLSSGSSRRGVFGLVDRRFLETEFLKSLLSSMRYSVARSIYDDAIDRPLDSKVLEDTVVEAALAAFDNSSNPNRTRGGLKKCDDIIHSFPNIMGSSPPVPAVRRINALLQATHALSKYRLVLKQGEPFSPVVLRVHSDPVSIIGRVLEQNPKSYTKLQEFAEAATNMILAGLYERKRTSILTPNPPEVPLHLSMTEKRVTAMCIEAALAEDDFETAYSYVVSRLASPEDKSNGGSNTLVDTWSWKAALKAGQYIRTTKTTRPTHLGTASGNPDIRHLEQRIECLATALRIAPAGQLQEILKTFRRCEEQLDSAIKEETAHEEAWDAAGDMRSPSIPGAFSTTRPHQAAGSSVRGMRPADGAAQQMPRQKEEGPVSLFDLGRATAEAAKRNLGVLSSPKGDASQYEGGEDEPRARKRDQLRDAAMGTLVSGVGWLVGAPATSRE